MINNPKILLIEEEWQRADNRVEIEKQFEEEKITSVRLLV